jgi:Xaa-Pro aminopeptidase
MARDDVLVENARMGGDQLAALPTSGEYAARLEAVRARMGESGLGLLVVSDPANLYYLTGYNAWSFYTPQLLAVPHDGEMVLFARAMDAAGAHRTCFLGPEHVEGYPERLVHRRDEHPFDWVADRIRDRGLLPTGGVVGIEMDAHFLTPKAFAALESGLAPTPLVDCHELVNWVRAVKSDAEIALMRTAARVADAAMRAAVESVRVGAPQYVVAAEIQRAQVLGDGDAWGDFPAIVPLLPTSESADTPHLTWSDRILADGDAVVVEIAGVHRRYHVPLARTVVLGSPPDGLAGLEAPVAEGLDAVLHSMRPGVPVGDAARAWDEVIGRHGLTKPSRLGYSIGIGYPPDWGERTISIRADEATVLEPGMTFHVICGMWLRDLGYEVSHSVVVTDSGVDRFSELPAELVRR